MLLDLGTLAVKIRADGTDKTKKQLDGLKSGVEGIKKAAKVAVKGIAAASAAITAGFGAAIKVGADFEAQMSTVSAISGASAEDMNKLGEKAKEMGIKTKFSATEAGQAMEYMAMAGWKTEDMLNGVEGIMNLAAASGEDLAAVSDIVTDAMTAFGLAADQSGRFADVLAAASSNSNTNVGMMGETFKYVAPVAGAMKFSIEDTAVAIGLMANAGIKGSQAGTALRSTLSRLAKPPKEARDAMEALNLTVTNTDGSFKNFNQITVELREKFGALNDSQKTMYANMLGGQEAMSGLLAIVNASDADFNKLSEAIKNSAGSAENMANIRLDDLQGQITLLKSSLEGLGVAIYKSNNAIITGAIEKIKEYVNALNEAFSNGGFSGMIAKTGDILADAVTQIGGQAPALIEAAQSLISTFAAAISNNAGKIGEQASNIVFTLVNSILQLLPQILQAGIDIIVSLGNGLANGLPQLIPQMVDTILTLVETIINNIDSIIDTGEQIIQALIDGIINSLPIIIEKAPEIIAELVSAIIRNAPKMAVASLQIILSLAKGIMSFAGELYSRIPEFVQGAIAVFKQGFETAKDIGTHIITGIWNGILGAKEWLWNNIKKWAGQFVNGVKELFGIHSPSRVMRDEVGRYIAEGVAAGIDDNKDKVLNSITALGKDTRTEVQKVKDEINKTLLDSEKKYNKESERLKNSKKKSDKAYLENLKKTAEEERKIYDALQKDIENQKKAIINDFDEIAQKAFKSVSEIQKAQESMREKLADYGNLYSEKTLFIMNGKEYKKTTLDNLAEQTEKLKQYKDLLENIKKRADVPKEFFEAMRDMSVDEGVEYGKLLTSLSDKDFNQYISDWKEKQETAKDISKELYKDETENLQKTLIDGFSKTPEEFFEIGEDSVKSFGKGFMDNLAGVMENVKNTISDIFGSLLPSDFYGEQYLTSKAAVTASTTKPAPVGTGRNYDGVTVYQNFYTKTATPSEVYNATKKATNDMEVNSKL